MKMEKNVKAIKLESGVKSCAVINVKHNMV